MTDHLKVQDPQEQETHLEASESEEDHVAWAALTCVVSLGIDPPVAELYRQLFTSLSSPAVDNAAARQQLNGKTGTIARKSALRKTILQLALKETPHSYQAHSLL